MACGAGSRAAGDVFLLIGFEWPYMQNFALALKLFPKLHLPFALFRRARTLSFRFPELQMDSDFRCLHTRSTLEKIPERDNVWRLALGKPWRGRAPVGLVVGGSPKWLLAAWPGWRWTAATAAFVGHLY